MMLEKRTLGKTDIKISPIGIGVMMWMQGKGLMGRLAPTIEEDVRNELIQMTKIMSSAKKGELK